MKRTDLQDAESVSRAIGAEVRRHRRDAGLTGEDLAQRSGVGLSKFSISKIENGDRAVSAAELLALAKALGVEPVALLAPPTPCEACGGTGLIPARWEP